jgi:hypothetical protein
VNRYFGGTCRLHLQGRRIRHDGSSTKQASSTVKTVIRSSETSVDFYWTALHFIPEDILLHKHRCENLKPYYFTLQLSGEKGQSTFFLDFSISWP